MQRPCRQVLQGCPGVDAPITNISAEAPDPLLFAGIPYDPFDWHAPPRLGNGLKVDADCPNFLASTFANYSPVIYAQTQLMANLQALAAELGCTWPENGDQIYTNDAQTATVYCPDGTAFTYTVDAGTLTSPLLDTELGAAFVIAANAWAAAYAFEQASALMDCIDPDPDTPPEPGPRKPTIPLGPGILPGPVWMCFGEEFFHRYRVSGHGASEYTLSITAGALPPGTTFSQDGPKSGFISGTPTVPGEYSFTITGVSTTLPTVTVEVTDYVWVMGITNADTLPDAAAANAYGPETLLATGGTAPYTFTSSNLPGGFSLTSDGILTSDASIIAGDYTFDVTITDANGGSCTQDVSISVIGQCEDWADLTWGSPTIHAFGGAVISFAPDSIPGVAFNASITAPDTSTDYGDVSNTATITVDGNPCACNLHLELTRVNLGGIVSQGNVFIQIPAGISLLWSFTSGTTDGLYDIPFNLPDNGGIPHNITVIVGIEQHLFVGGGARSTTLLGSLSCCSITNTSPLPSGTMFVPYSEQLHVAYMDAPYTFTISAGALPTGLNLSPAGLISGTPTIGGPAFAFSVEVTNALGQVCAKDFTMDVGSAPPDWSSLLWGNDAEFSAGAGTSSFSPELVTSDSFSAMANAPDGTTDWGFADNTATLSYNGVACTAHLHVTASFVGTDYFAQITIVPIGFTANVHIDGPGIHDYPIAIPNTMGVPLNMTVHVGVQAPNVGTPAGQQNATISGVFSNT